MEYVKVSDYIATSSMVEDFEKEYGKLPEDYKEYLLEVNGGIPRDMVKNFKHNGQVVDVRIDQIYSLSSGEETYGTLQWAIKNIEDLNTSEFLPIGGAPGGEITMGIGEKFFGMIFIDFEIQNLKHDKMYRLADSFSSFLNSENHNNE